MCLFILTSPILIQYYTVHSSILPWKWLYFRGLWFILPFCLPWHFFGVGEGRTGRGERGEVHPEPICCQLGCNELGRTHTQDRMTHPRITFLMLFEGLGVFFAWRDQNLKVLMGTTHPLGEPETTNIREELQVESSGYFYVYFSLCSVLFWAVTKIFWAEWLPNCF